MKEKRVTICFTLPAEMVPQLDKYAKSMKMDRSHFLEWLLETAFPHVKPVANLLKDAFRASIQMKEQNEEGEPG